MSSHENTEPIDLRQAQIDSLLQLVSTLLSRIDARSPGIAANELYTTEQVIERLGVSPNTVQTWVEFNGLQASRPGTSKHLFYGQHLIDFVIANKTGITKPSSAKEKNAIRKSKIK